VQLYEQAAALAPGQDIYAVKLAAGAQTAAQASEHSAKRRRYFLRALRAIEAACALVPACPDHHANRGRLLFLVAREELAPPHEMLEAFDTALAGDPRNTCFLADAGQCAAALGLHQRARDYLWRGLEEDPDLAVLHAGLGRLALLRGRYKEAEQHLQTALLSDWHGDGEAQQQSLSLLGVAWFYLGRVEAAYQLATDLLALRPTWQATRLTRARALERLGRRAEARKEYQRLLAVQPDYEAAKEGLRRLAAGK
jgi:tetratricopeptide (TPR) repeat protein